MYDYTLHRVKKRFCRYCLQAFRTADVLKCYIKDWFKINCKQKIKILQNGEYVRFKNYERKIKSPFMTYADLENTLESEDNGKQTPNESYTDIYKKTCCL